MIGKTRQEPLTESVPTTEVAESFDPALGQPRGVLRRPLPSAGKFRHARRSAPPELASWIDHYWMVYWDLRSCEPRQVETLPHPNVHVVFEEPESRAWGISTTKFSRLLEGKSHSFGIKFTPGGFFPFLGSSVSLLANRSVPVCQIFGDAAHAIEQAILATEDEDEMTAAASAFLLDRIPKLDKKVDEVRQLVARILRERDILTVEDFAARTGISVRFLQRLFSQYVGASPKWVIRRYRLHELLEQMHSGRRPDWAELAVDLGYFDQAHLINDFKSIVGYAPTEYPGLEPPRGSV
jgi:AraC-like DNA-binding protein